MQRSNTVVVVDDEPEILEIIGEVLDDDGFQVICIGQPRQAIETVYPDGPSLYVLDLMLPERNGIQLAREIRARREDTVRILGMSASHEMLHRARQSGLFDELLAKPFDLADLLDRIEWHAV